MSVPEIIAIVISIFSVIFAAISLGWNIYRDVVMKPKVKVGFRISRQFRGGFCGNTEKAADFQHIDVVNFGPGAVKISGIWIRNSSLWKKLRGKIKRGFVLYDPSIGMGTALPKKLEVGENADFFLLYDKECLLSKEWTHIGVSDTFGRLHLAEKRDVDKARERWTQDFDGKTLPPENTNKHATE